MKIFQSWERNMPTTDGYSITIKYTYSSRIMSEIDAIERKLPQGMIVMDTDQPQRLIRCKEDENIRPQF